MKIELFDQPFDPWQWAKAFQDSEQHLQHQFGATTIFIGSMRDFNEGDDVQSMVLEHYPGMTEKHLHEIADSAKKKWDIIDLCIAHRIGEVHPGEAIVCVIVWSTHRKEAYEANRMIMEDLKSKAPFWKKEQLVNKSRWVERNTQGF